MEAFSEEQENEIEVLQSVYGDNFVQGTLANSFSLRLYDPEDENVACTVCFTFPTDYPFENPPEMILQVSHLKFFDERETVTKCFDLFQKEELVVHEWCQTIEDELSRVGELMRKNRDRGKVQSEDINNSNSSGRTTLIHFDHMNNFKGYTKLLSKWAKQLRLGGVIFLPRNCKPRPRHIFAILDSAELSGETSEFLTRLRTQNVDVNSRGVPCKERMSTVVSEFSRLIPKGASGEFRIISVEGASGSQAHIPFVEEWLQREYESNDAQAIFEAMENFLESMTNKSKKRSVS